MHAKTTSCAIILALLFLSAGCDQEQRAWNWPWDQGETSTSEPAYKFAPDAAEVELVTDFSEIVQNRRDVTVSLTFQNIRPLPSGEFGNVTVQLEKRAGKWADPNHHSASADYNQKSDNSVEISNVTMHEGKLSGDLRVTIRHDRPRHSRSVGFPSEPDVFKISFAADVKAGLHAPYQPSVETFMPSYRQDTPSYGGDLILGGYKATRGGESLKGKVLGAVSPAPVPGKLGVQGNGLIEQAPGGGMRFTARLSPKRTAPPESAYAVLRFEKPRDWSRFDGLRLVVRAPKRRHDAAVSIAISEAGGGWYGVTSAATLTEEEMSFVVPFEDFRGGSDNYALDVDAIDAIQVGVDNPYGVGDVMFDIRRVELVRWGKGFGHAPSETVEVRLDPKVAIRVGDTREIPKGLFGFHDVWHSEPRQPEGAPEPIEYTRTINPGYFRPLDHVGFASREEGAVGAEQPAEKACKQTADSIEPGSWFHRRASAAGAVDNVVWTHTEDLWNRPSWMDRGIAPVARGVKEFYHEIGKIAWKRGDDDNPLRRLEVWNEPFMWARHMNLGARNPKGAKEWTDQTQYGYYPAKVITDVYSRLFEAAVAGARQANPDVMLGGPCSPSFNGDNYAVFTNHVRRFVDRCGDEVDFLTEHHYFGQPDSYATSYLVAAAYCDVNLGRRIPVYNTECNDLSSGKWASARKAHYNIVDILTCATQTPDIVKGRAVHALWGGYLRDPGETHAFTLLSTLRGEMRKVSISDPNLLAIASRNDSGDLVVVVHNKTRFRRRIRFAPPRGLTLAEQLHLTIDEGQTKLIRRSPAADESVTYATELEPMETVRWTLRPATGGRSPKARTTRSVSQSFCDVLFTDVNPGGSVTGKVIWRQNDTRQDGEKPGDLPAARDAKKAYLRVVTRDVHRGEAIALVNGHEVQLPWSSSNDSCAVMQDIEIPVEILKPTTTIKFACKEGKWPNGFTVFAASIVLEN